MIPESPPFKVKPGSRRRKTIWNKAKPSEGKIPSGVFATNGTILTRTTMRFASTKSAAGLVMVEKDSTDSTRFGAKRAYAASASRALDKGPARKTKKFFGRLAWLMVG